MGAEIKKLIKEGHIVKLDKCTSDHFVAPVVITAKKDGTVKLAMDAKPMNSQIYKNTFQMPNLLELLDSAAQTITANTEGTVWFTSLDLKYAFSQLLLDEFVSKHCNFSIVCGEFTGTYRFKTGFYGLTDMPMEFQKAMDNTIHGIQGVFCFLDDILIESKGSVKEHNETVDKVLSRLDKEGFALKLSKCEFSKTKLIWLGFEIDETEVRPKHSKIEAVMALQPPKSLKQLRSFMGILNHMSRFIPNLQKHTEPLRPSLKADNKEKFIWSEEANNAFQKTLELIANITKMHHYDANKHCRIKCDASHKGLGAALEQELEPDKWVPIAFTSRFLNAAEQKYSTNELELLAVVWSCEFFRNYLLGNQFQILTDHKAIITAITENWGNKTYQSRLTRWADRMLPFEYTISHIAGAKIGMSDYLSRSPKFEAPPTSKYDEQFVVKAIENFDEACRVINTPAPTKEIGQIQLVKAHLEENRINSKRFTLIGKENGGKHPISEAPQGGVDISYKGFIQSDLRCRTAKSNKTSDTEGTSINQSGSDMQRFTPPQEGASSCGTDTSQSDQCMQIHIPEVRIGNLCGKTTTNQNKICKCTTHHERAESHAVKILTNQIRHILIYSQLRHI